MGRPVHNDSTRNDKAAEMPTPTFITGQLKAPDQGQQHEDDQLTARKEGMAATPARACRPAATGCPSGTAVARQEGREMPPLAAAQLHQRRDHRLRRRQAQARVEQIPLPVQGVLVVVGAVSSAHSSARR